MIAAVTFDGDGTLWDVLSGASSALGAVAETISRHRETTVTVTELEQARSDAEHEHPDWSMEALRRQSFAVVLARYGPAGTRLDTDRLWQQFLAARRAHTRTFDDVLPALRLLRDRQVRTCLLSNGNTLPEHVGLDGMFDHVQAAEYAGVRKPDPAAFATAATALRCAPEQILHVGDDPREDHAAALAAGFRAVLLRRSGPSSDDVIATLAPVPVPDIVARSHVN